MILMSAIRFYIDKTDEEVILCGLRHSNIFDQLKSLGFKARSGYEEIEQGFLNDSGEFLTRTQALEEAKRCGQIDEENLIHKNQLFSEDLW